jgi:hypothetical protein
MGKERKVYKCLVGKPKGKNHLEDKGIDERMGLEWILGKLTRRVWSGFTWLRIRAGGSL